MGLIIIGLLLIILLWSIKYGFPDVPGFLLLCFCSVIVIAMLSVFIAATISLFPNAYVVSKDRPAVTLQKVDDNKYAIVTHKDKKEIYYLRNTSKKSYENIITIDGAQVKEIIYSDTEVPTLYVNHYEYKSVIARELLLETTFIPEDDYTLVVPKESVQYGD